MQPRIALHRAIHRQKLSSEDINKMQSYNRAIFIILITAWSLISSIASAKTTSDQFHIKLGMVNSSLGTSIGVEGGNFAVVPSFDFEYETFVTSRRSYVLRSTMALDMASTVTRYLFAGIGQRVYMNSRGSQMIAVTPDISIIMQPKFRYYLGWDAGVSTAVVSVLTASLQSVTTAIDGGGVAGVLYQISDNFTFDASMTMSYAFGFSAVPATGLIMKMFFGGAYYF